MTSIFRFAGVLTAACVGASASWGCAGGESLPPHGTGGTPAVPGNVLPTTADEFTLAVRSDTVPIAYEYESFRRQLADASSDASGAGDAATELFRITEADVEAFTVGPYPSPGLEFRLTTAAGQRLRSILSSLGERHPFFASVRGQELFAGVTYPWFGAAAIGFPVLTFTADDHPTLHVAARQGAGFVASTKAESERLDRTEVRDVFRARGKLREGNEPPVPNQSSRP